jgi:dihydropteroate synthase
MDFSGRNFTFTFPRPAIVVGIVNVTPDSFSDGGRFYHCRPAVEHALRLVEEGAEIIDIGGESTRPRAEPVSSAEELRRVMPVIEEVRARSKVVISIDTRKPEVAQSALEAGASLVNDIGANREEDAMFQLIGETGAGYVLMHMQGTPETMQDRPIYNDVAEEISIFFAEKTLRAAQSGIRPEQIILDPGIGFGKSLEHNLQLLAKLDTFKQHSRPLLIGASRKSFMSRLLGADVSQRLGPSIACAVWAVEQGVQLVRAHDVAETVRAIRMAEAIMERRKCSSNTSE